MAFQRTDGSLSPPADIFTADQLSGIVARENDENAKLMRLVMWRYLPVDQPRVDADLPNEKVSISCATEN